MKLHITKKVQHVPHLPYQEIGDAVLGKDYVLSLVFVGERRAQTLNTRYRNATYIPNILSFPLDLTHGEIYITPLRAKKEAPKWNMTIRGYIGFLFIHGILHLKGHLHGATMEEAEKKLVSSFSLH